jgi:putative LysE/RhtB family amino acid efflux pump
MPVGAVGALCLRRGLQRRWIVGIATGIGAAAADGMLAGAAVYGISFIIGYILDNEALFRFGGGVFLLMLGIYMIICRNTVATSAEKNAANHREHAGRITGAVATGFFLTIINPATLFAFIGVFAAFDLVDETDHPEGAEMIVSGVIMGSLLWWITLTTGSCMMRRRLPANILGIINGVLGIVVGGLGGFSLLSVLPVIF